MASTRSHEATSPGVGDDPLVVADLDLHELGAVLGGPRADPVERAVDLALGVHDEAEAPEGESRARAVGVGLGQGRHAHIVAHAASDAMSII